MISIALSDDTDFVEKVGAILGVLSIEPGCGDRNEQRFVIEAIDFLGSI